MRSDITEWGERRVEPIASADFPVVHSRPASRVKISETSAPWLAVESWMDAMNQNFSHPSERYGGFMNSQPWGDMVVADGLVACWREKFDHVVSHKRASLV